jgi:hypothetical protein
MGAKGRNSSSTSHPPIHLIPQVAGKADRGRREEVCDVSSSRDRKRLERRSVVVAIRAPLNCGFDAIRCKRGLSLHLENMALDSRTAESDSQGPGWIRSSQGETTLPANTEAHAWGGNETAGSYDACGVVGSAREIGDPSATDTSDLPTDFVQQSVLHMPGAVEICTGSFHTMMPFS